MYEEIREQARRAMTELLEAAKPVPGSLVVVGCSSSEIMGANIGKGSTPEAAQAVLEGLLPPLQERGLYLAAQCCEHLNRALILEREAAEKFGSQCVVVAIDAKKRADGSGWNIYKNGGRIDVGIDAVEWAKKAESLGAGEILLTSMDCDGTKAGYDIELTRTIAESVGIPVIASGGAGTLEHFYDALTEGKADAALAASLFHYKELEIREVKEYLAGRNVPVRL